MSEFILIITLAVGLSIPFYAIWLSVENEKIYLEQIEIVNLISELNAEHKE